MAVKSETMMKAAESGQEGIRRAADRDQQESQFSREHSARAQAQHQSAFQNQQQIDEQVTSNVVREKQNQQQIDEQIRSNKMGEAIKQDEQDIDMADRGLKSSGKTRAEKAGEKPSGSSQDPRSPQGQQAQQQRSPEDQAGDARYAQQAEQPLEVAGPDQRTIAPTEQRIAEKKSQLETNSLNAQANYMNAARNYNQAHVKGDKEGMSKAAQTLQNGINDSADLFDMGKAGALSAKEWDKIDDLATMDAGKVPDPQLQQEIMSKTWGPALSRFMSTHIQHQNLRFMAVTGEMPNGDYVDMASPQMRQFTEESAAAQQYLRAADFGGMLSLALNVQSLADRNRSVRKMAASVMLNGQSIIAMMGGGDDVIGSQGQNAQPQQQPGIGPQLGAGARAGAAAGGAARGAASVAGTAGPARPPRPGGGAQLPGTPGTPRNWDRDVK
jgi:hypothetical protein